MLHTHVILNGRNKPNLIGIGELDTEVIHVLLLGQKIRHGTGFVKKINKNILPRNEATLPVTPGLLMRYSLSEGARTDTTHEIQRCVAKYGPRSPVAEPQLYKEYFLNAGTSLSPTPKRFAEPGPPTQRHFD